MKKVFFIMALMFCTFISWSADITPVNPNASPEAIQLLNYLKSIQGEHTLSGQHNYPGKISWYTKKAHEITGKYPAVWGQDFGFTAEGKDGIIHRQDVMDEAKRQYEKGSIITLMWHAVRPIDDEPSGWKSSVQNDLTDEQWKDLVTPGTKIHTHWLKQLDVVAEYLKQLRDANIPVLWRPYHEMNGGWFWWGKKEGENGYKALWRNMYNHFVNHHKLNNLLWVWNANAPLKNTGPLKDYFPGLNYVDIVAADFYEFNYEQSHYEDILELADGKPIAIGECGQMPTPEILDKQPKWTWFMTWSGFLYNKNEPNAVKKLYHDPRVLTREEVN